MKRILMIATGGTIASESSAHGLHPALTSEDLLLSVPEVSDICEVDTIQLMNLDSTDITPADWLQMADTIEKNYHKYDSFVITHGTDTMAYTAAALSYLIQNSPKAIVLTGAQKSISLSNTDARSNLIDSFLYASDDLSHGVTIVFNGKVILGTRARKERTRSYNAFSSVDYPEVAVIRERKIIRFLQTDMNPSSKPVFYHFIDPSVLVITLIPGISGAAIRNLKNDYHALVIQSFGVGGLPGGGKGELACALNEWVKADKPVILTTQVPYEGGDLSTYQVGAEIKELYPVIEAHDMTLEAITAKLMWALTSTKKPQEIERLFSIPINHDIL
ncbi:MAG: asparaginase [Oscillospiraceae bacterium]|nr:asparaginase [Oscillospiraceae bacterium]